MSTEFKVIKNTGKDNRDLSITQFYGGDTNKSMLQITQGFGTILNSDEPGFIQLKSTDVYLLIVTLTEWLKLNAHNEAEILNKEIEKHIELRGTIFEQAVKCEAFIQELKMLELPVTLLHKLS